MITFPLELKAIAPNEAQVTSETEMEQTDGDTWGTQHFLVTGQDNYWMILPNPGKFYAPILKAAPLTTGQQKMENYEGIWKQSPLGKEWGPGPWVLPGSSCRDGHKGQNPECPRAQQESVSYSVRSHFLPATRTLQPSASRWLKLLSVKT